MNKTRVVIIILILLFPSLCFAADAKLFKSITVAGITGSPLLEYTDSLSKPCGLYVDFWQVWSEKTGIDVKYIVTTREDAHSGIQSGRYDAVMGYDVAVLPDKNLEFTDSIFKREVFIYRNKKISSVEKLHDLVPFVVGALPGDGENLSRLNDNIVILKRNSVPMLFDEADKGRISVFIADEVSANYELSRKGRWKHFYQSSEPLYTKSVKAIVKAGRENLRNVINTGISKITESEKFFLLKTYAGGNFTYSLPWGYISVVVVTLLLLCGLLFIWLWNVRLKVTVDRTTRELMKMKEAAEAASEAKTVFLDNISHELRTPLTLILAPIESALDGKELDTGTLSMIRRNGRNLLELINDLLDLSKVESGRAKLNVKKTNICRLAEIYCAEMASAAAYKNIHINCDVPDYPLELYVDQTQILTVLANLFSNSIKHTGAGGSISVAVFDKGDEVLISFSDTGKGIESCRIDTIFDRFTMAHESADNKVGGTGIGLSLVKGILELHGGAVTVESRYLYDFPDNHGTDFFLTIPKGREHFDSRDDVEFSETDLLGGISSYLTLPHKELPGYIDKPGETDEEADRPAILVVDDNSDMRKFLKNILSSHFNVRTSGDGIDALNYLRDNPETDLVVSDLMMPRMDGHELLEKIHSDENLLHIPLLFLSARADDMVKYKGFELGAVDYVVKPFSPYELVLRIRKQIEMHQARNSLIKKNEELYSKLKEKLSPKSESNNLTDAMKEKMEKVCEFIRENFTENITRENVSDIIDLNTDSFGRAFKRYTGKNFADYTYGLRLAEAKKNLTETDLTVTRISINTGFDSLRTFNRIFKKHTGMSPSNYRGKVLPVLRSKDRDPV